MRTTVTTLPSRWSIVRSFSTRTAPRRPRWDEFEDSNRAGIGGRLSASEQRVSSHPSSSSTAKPFPHAAADTHKTSTSNNSEATPSWWKRQPGVIANDDPRMERLSKEMEDFAISQLPDENYVREKDRFLLNLQKMVNQVFDKATVSPFGSVINGFWTKNSDLDVCIQVPGATTRMEQIKLLKKLAAQLQRVPTHYIEPRFGAKLPIINWSPRQPGMLACDISINNTLAIVNSRLIGHYALIDPRVRTIGITIKHWAAQRGINDRSVGTLSSFSLIMMLVHLLQKRNIPILPSLQDIAMQRNHSAIYVNGVDCRFSTDKVEIEEEMEYLRRSKPANSENAGFLLHEFFKYYGFDYKQGVIAIRDRDAFTPQEEENSYLFVDNPFEIGKDVANVEVAQQSRIRQEFRRAQALIFQGRSLEELKSAWNPDKNKFVN